VKLDRGMGGIVVEMVLLVGEDLGRTGAHSTLGRGLLGRLVRGSTNSREPPRSRYFVSATFQRPFHKCQTQ
jgi:hypothetical protein